LHVRAPRDGTRGLVRNRARLAVLVIDDVAALCSLAASDNLRTPVDPPLCHDGTLSGSALDDHRRLIAIRVGLSRSSSWRAKRSDSDDGSGDDPHAIPIHGIYSSRASDGVALICALDRRGI
jgi:hypothetical protein